MAVTLRMLAVGVEPLRHNQVQIVLGAGVPVANLISLELIENRAMLLRDERSCQAHCLDGRRSVSVADSA